MYQQKREKITNTQQFKSEVFIPVAIHKVVINRSDIPGSSTKPSRERKRSDLFEMLDQPLEDDQMDRYQIVTSQSQLAQSSILCSKQQEQQKGGYILEEEAEVESIPSS